MSDYYTPSKKEITSVMNVNIDKRLKYFRNTVGNYCYLWLCCDGEGNLFVGYDNESRECISVWPLKEYADFVLTKSKLKAFDSVEYLKSMEIHDFLEEYIDELAESNIHILVFPTENGGAIMTAESFRNMMEEELARYEDEDEYENDSIEKRLGKNKQE